MLIEILNQFWPIILSCISLIVVLAKMYNNIESLKEKVRILFDFHNNRDK
jgi:hypothetical protein